jgi:hypothetical protein
MFQPGLAVSAVRVLEPRQRGRAEGGARCTVMGGPAARQQGCGLELVAVGVEAPEPLDSLASRVDRGGHP